MDVQVYFNVAMAAIAILGGWVAKLAYSQLNRLREDYDELYDTSKEDYRALQKYHENDLRSVRREMAELALSLPEKYVSKQDLEKLIEFINERFNKLEVKIDQINKP